MIIDLHLLQRAVLTEMVQNTVPSFSVITNGVFGTLPAEARGSDLYGYRVMEKETHYSRFVPENTSAIPVSEGRGERVMVKIPHQRIKTSLNPSDVFRERGIVFYDDTTEGSTAQKIAQGVINERVMEIVGQHTQRMDNTFEWMGVQALQGSLSYVVQGQDAFVADFGRSGDNDVVLTGGDLWTATTSNPALDVRAAQKQVNKKTGLRVNAALMSPEATAAFLTNEEVIASLDRRNVNVGTLDMTQGYGDAGTLGYVGHYAGIDWWELDNEMTVAGTTSQYIPAGEVLFVAITPEAMARKVYCPITDFDMTSPQHGSGALKLSGSTLDGRMAKSFGLPDPSSTWVLSAASEMPEIKKPNFTYSLKVTA